MLVDSHIETKGRARKSVERLSKNAALLKNTEMIDWSSLTTGVGFLTSACFHYCFRWQICLAYKDGDVAINSGLIGDKDFSLSIVEDATMCVPNECFIFHPYNHFHLPSIVFRLQRITQPKGTGRFPKL